MNSLLILLTAICFYFIGRYSVKRPKTIKQTIDDIVRKRRKPKAGIIPFKTSNEFTAEYKNDKKLEKEWIKSGKAREVMR